MSVNAAVLGDGFAVEAQEPVKHLVPLPEAVVKAMCTLGWFHEWYGWALATALPFYVGQRLRLKCCREDLLFPSFLAEDGYVPVFLRLRFFKSKFRNPAHAQHLKISDATKYILLHLVLRNLDSCLTPTPTSFASAGTSCCSC